MLSLDHPVGQGDFAAAPRRRRAICLVWFSLFGALLAQAAEPHVVHVGTAKSEARFDGWGTSLCWFANAVGRWPEPQRSEIADALFSTSGLGLTFVRYNIGGGENPEHNHMPWFRQMEGFLPKTGEWNWAADAGQRWMLAAALQRGANRVEAFSNAPPYWMTLSGCVSGGSDPNQDNLDPHHEAAFIEYLVTVAQHFQTEWGIRFDTIDPMNEPYTDYWRANGKQEGCHFERASQARLILRLRAALDRRGIQRLGISAADETNYARAIETWKSYDAATRECVAVINAHAYDTAHRTELRALAREADRPLVMSEVDGGGGEPHDHAAIRPALVLADQIVDDLRDLQPLRWTFWQAVEDESGMVGANNNWGLLHADLLGDSHAWVKTKKFHAMAQFTKFIRPGAVWASCDDAESVAMHDRARNVLIIVTCNPRTDARTLTYILSSSDHAAAHVKAYRTSATEDLAELPVGEVAQDARFSAQLPAESITTFIVQLDAPAARD